MLKQGQLMVPYLRVRVCCIGAVAHVLPRDDAPGVNTAAGVTNLHNTMHHLHLSVVCVDTINLVACGGIRVCCRHAPVLMAYVAW